MDFTSPNPGITLQADSWCRLTYNCMNLCSFFTDGLRWQCSYREVFDHDWWRHLSQQRKESGCRGEIYTQLREGAVSAHTHIHSPTHITHVLGSTTILTPSSGGRYDTTLGTTRHHWHHYRRHHYFLQHPLPPYCTIHTLIPHTETLLLHITSGQGCVVCSRSD